FPATIAADKFGGDLNGFSSIPAPQVWVDARTPTNITGSPVKNGYLFGQGNAPVGLLMTLGANLHLESVYALNHSEANFVFDGPQNSAFVNLRSGTAPVNI